MIPPHDWRAKTLAFVSTVDKNVGPAVRAGIGIGRSTSGGMAQIEMFGGRRAPKESARLLPDESFALVRDIQY